MEYNYYNDPNFRIAIYIGGNVERGNGFGQIVSVGLLAGNEYQNLDAAPISRANTIENPVFTIKNTASYVLYKIWDDSILISDDNNNGRLCIGLTIPSNARLSNGKSPYTLLMSVHQVFLEKGTALTEDGKRRFKKEELDKNLFQSIVDEYPIEFVQNRVVPMAGNRRGQLQITSTREMEDFFRDTQYEEFAEYEAVEVTTQGLNMFPGLRIPKPKGYQIIVNGQLAKDLTNKEKAKILWEGRDEQFIARCDSTLDYRYEPMAISIDKLRRAHDTTLTSQDGSSKAVLDEKSQSIICTLNPIPKWYYKEVKYDANSNDDAEKYCKENLGKRIKIRVNGQEWNEDKIMPSRVAEQRKDGSIEIRKDLFSVSPEETGDFRFSISNVVLNSGDKLFVFIKAEKKRSGGRHGSGGGSTGSGLDRKSLLIGAVIGIALGVGGFWAVQTYIKNKQATGVEKQKKGKEKAAWTVLEELAPKNPTEAMSCRDYLRNFSNGVNVISKGDAEAEKLHGEFSCADDFHVRSVKNKLQKYVDDSIAAERAEEEAFEACTDTTACNNYLKAYNPCRGHQYFEKGKHVEEVKQKKATLEKKQKDDDDKKIQDDLTKVRKSIIEDVEKKALNYLNEKDLIGFRKWLNQNNSEWKVEVNENKNNRALLGETKTNAVEWILGYRNQKYKKNKEDQAVPLNQNQMQGIKTYLNSHTNPYNTWEDVMTTKKEIDKILSENAD